MKICSERLIILDEISRQLISSKPKIIFTLPDTYNTVKLATEIAKQSMEIVTIKYGSNQDVPSDAINFSELINTSGAVTFNAKFNIINNVRKFQTLTSTH